MSSLNEILALTRTYNKSDSTAFVTWQKSGVTKFSIGDSGLTTISVVNIGATPANNGSYLVNNTDAAAGAQQYSPSIVMRGRGWKTDAVAASQTVDFMAYVRPIQGTANPTGELDIQASVNGAAYSTALSIRSAGGLGDTLFGVGTVRIKLSTDGSWAYFGTATKTDAIYMSDTGSLQTLTLIPQAGASYDNGQEGNDWNNIWARTAIYTASAEATVGAQLKDSGSLTQRAHHWNGASVDWDFAMQHTMITAGASPKSYETFKINAVQAFILGNNAGAPLLGFYGLAAPVAQPAHIADPSGGATQDAEARTAINSINAMCATLGLTAAA